MRNTCQTLMMARMTILEPCSLFLTHLDGALCSKKGSTSAQKETKSAMLPQNKSQMVCEARFGHDYQNALIEFLLAFFLSFLNSLWMITVLISHRLNLWAFLLDLALDLPAFLVSWTVILTVFSVVSLTALLHSLICPHLWFHGCL